MNIETYNRREKMLKLREELLAVEEDRVHDSKGYSVGGNSALPPMVKRQQYYDSLHKAA